MGIGDWGLGMGIGDWGLGPMPQTPKPKPKPQVILKFLKIKYFL